MRIFTPQRSVWFYAKKTTQNEYMECTRRIWRATKMIEDEISETIDELTEYGIIEESKYGFRLSEGGIRFALRESTIEELKGLLVKKRRQRRSIKSELRQDLEDYIIEIKRELERRRRASK